MSKDGMDYEVTGSKKPKNAKKVVLSQLNSISTPSILWYVVKRHKVGILASWAIIMTALYVFPPLPDYLFGLVGR